MAETRHPLDDAGSGLIYCGLCGALNPATNHYCAACGTTLVDAFHANEGLRVYERPDPAARLIEIVPTGTELDIVEDEQASADYVRIRLGHGRLGYIRVGDVGATGPGAPARRGLPSPDINTHARGCVSTTSALAALALLLIAAVFGIVIIMNARPADSGILTLFFCVTVGPLLLLTVGLYVGARSREDRLEAEAEDAEQAAP